MIVFRISIADTRYPAVHPPSSGRSPIGWSVVSNAKTTEASSARDAPANIAAIPTSAQMRVSIPNCGTSMLIPSPIATPQPPPIVNNGASVPPEVPLPREIDQEMNFQRQSAITALPAMPPVTMP